MIGLGLIGCGESPTEPDDESTPTPAFSPTPNPTVPAPTSTPEPTPTPFETWVFSGSSYRGDTGERIGSVTFTRDENGHISGTFAVYYACETSEGDEYDNTRTMDVDTQCNPDGSFAFHHYESWNLGFASGETTCDISGIVFESAASGAWSYHSEAIDHYAQAMCQGDGYWAASRQ